MALSIVTELLFAVQANLETEQLLASGYEAGEALHARGQRLCLFHFGAASVRVQSRGAGPEALGLFQRIRCRALHGLSGEAVPARGPHAGRKPSNAIASGPTNSAIPSARCGGSGSFPTTALTLSARLRIASAMAQV